MFVVQGMTYVDENDNICKLNILDTKDGIAELINVSQFNSQIKKEIKYGRYITSTNSYPLILLSVNFPGLRRKGGFDILDIINDTPIDNNLVFSRLDDYSFSISKVGEPIGSIFRYSVKQIIGKGQSAQTLLTIDDSNMGTVYHCNWNIYNQDYDCTHPSFSIRLGVLEFSKLSEDIYQVYIVVYDKVTNIVVEVVKLQIDTDKDLIRHNKGVLYLHTIKFLQKSLSGII